MDGISEWLSANQELVRLLGTSSLAMLVITILVLPLVVMRLPENYFTPDHREPTRKSEHRGPLYALAVIVKNIFGLVLILVGMAMLVLPGQGALTILVGIALTNFPGKFAIERWFVRQPGVSRTLNWIRSKVGKPPLAMPTQPD